MDLRRILNVGGALLEPPFVAPSANAGETELRLSGPFTPSQNMAPGLPSPDTPGQRTMPPTPQLSRSNSHASTVSSPGPATPKSSEQPWPAHAKDGLALLPVADSHGAQMPLQRVSPQMAYRPRPPQMGPQPMPPQMGPQPMPPQMVSAPMAPQMFSHMVSPDMAPAPPPQNPPQMGPQMYSQSVSPAMAPETLMQGSPPMMAPPLFQGPMLVPCYGPPGMEQTGFFVAHQAGENPLLYTIDRNGYFGPPVTKKNKNTHPCPVREKYDCTDMFTTSGHAARHAKKHTGEKNAICPECNKAFTRKDNMTQHRRTHRRAEEKEKVRLEEEKRRQSAKVQKQQHKNKRRSSINPRAIAAFIEPNAQPPQANVQYNNYHSVQPRPDAPIRLPSISALNTLATVAIANQDRTA